MRFADRAENVKLFAFSQLYFHGILDEKLTMNIHRARSRATNSLNFNHGRTLAVGVPACCCSDAQGSATNVARGKGARAKVFYSWPAYITIGNLQRKRGFGGSVNLGKKLRIRDRCKSRELLDFRPTFDCRGSIRVRHCLLVEESRKMWSVLYSCIF